ncbi:putative EF-hand domain-containing protein [Helianthus annuus]|nr:putative EF-hand domain-containing protein [Helianthus annuus]KAJ0578222.1 putative EF-hand domain-containing protein [Helianthus annuus]KAJ0748250.1 putative EF-hand domain-containing protein [Helianthus annuus]
MQSSLRYKDFGSLTQLELGSLLRSLGLTPSPDQLDALIQKADTNSNGFVEFSEFVALVAPELLPAKSPYTDDQLKQFFKMLDRDGNGFLLLRLSWRIPWRSWDKR